MNTLMLIIRLIFAIVIAFFTGKLVTKLKLPAILGWLIAGMLMGPFALGLVNNALLDASWYNVLMDILEISLGIMIGAELVFKKLKKSGSKIFVTTIIQSIATFGFVSLVFGIIFHFIGVPLYVAFIFGGIALATAPAPALSIVKEFKTNGPVTKTLIPLAALDDIVAIIVFFSVTTIVSAQNTAQSSSLIVTLLLMIVLPILIGIPVGMLGGKVLEKERSKGATLMLTILLILLVGSVGLFFNHVILAEPMLNFMIIGMSFSATFANMLSEERLAEVMGAFNPVLGLSLIVVILSLGAPLDYKLMMSAGIFTAVYIVSRAIGKYTGAYAGAKIAGLSETVQKYLGLTLLPHSGVSLVFTGIAATTIAPFDPESAILIQGTIAAAAIINEILAVMIAKKAFEWAGEFDQR